MHKITSISLKMVKIVILSVAQLVTTVVSFSAWESHVLNGTIPEIQQRKWGPYFLTRKTVTKKLNNISKPSLKYLMIKFPTATPSSNEPDDLQGEDVYEDFESKDMIA